MGIPLGRTAGQNIPNSYADLHQLASKTTVLVSRDHPAAADHILARNCVLPKKQQLACSCRARHRRPRRLQRQERPAMLKHRWMGCCMTSCPPPGPFTGTVLHLPFLQTLLMHGSSVSGHTTGSCQHRPSSHQSSVQSSPSSQWFCKFGFVFRACYVLDPFVVGPLFVKAGHNGDDWRDNAALETLLQCKGYES